VHSKEEGEAFIRYCRYLLNGCKVWWEDRHNVQADLSAPTDPKHPCTRILLGNLDLLKYHHFQLYACLLNKWHEANVSLQEFLMLYILRKNVDRHYFFQSWSSIKWHAYITDLSRHNKDWYKEVLVVMVIWKVTSLRPGFIMFIMIAFYATMTWEIFGNTDLEAWLRRHRESSNHPIPDLVWVEVKET
ncbi:hypothetical protein DVH24_040145, partial [Malus domestica]